MIGVLIHFDTVQVRFIKVKVIGQTSRSQEEKYHQSGRFDLEWGLSSCLTSGSLLLLRWNTLSIGQIPLDYPGCRPGRRPGCRPVADRFELCRHIARTWSQTGLQQAFDQLSTGLRHAHAGLDPGRRPGLRLDSVMEFGLMPVCLACVVI